MTENIETHDISSHRKNARQLVANIPRTMSDNEYYLRSNIQLYMDALVSRFLYLERSKNYYVLAHVVIEKNLNDDIDRLDIVRTIIMQNYDTGGAKYHTK